MSGAYRGIFDGMCPDRETVGYLDTCGKRYCPACWRAQCAAGASHPAQLLTTGVGSARPFRIVDACTGCASVLDYDEVVPHA